MTPTSLREITTFLAVIVALTLTGYASAVLNGANKTRASVRNVIAGVFTMAITFAIGSLFR